MCWMLRDKLHGGGICFSSSTCLPSFHPFPSLSTDYRSYVGVGCGSFELRAVDSAKWAHEFSVAHYFEACSSVMSTLYRVLVWFSLPNFVNQLYDHTVTQAFLAFIVLFAGFPLLCRWTQSNIREMVLSLRPCLSSSLLSVVLHGSTQTCFVIIRNHYPLF